MATNGEKMIELVRARSFWGVPEGAAGLCTVQDEEGRERLRLLCAPENELARRFYDRRGFYPVGKQPGHRGDLEQLEKYIGYQPRPWAEIAHP